MSGATGKPGKLDPLEPFKISKAVNELNLNHVVITSVDRDDLLDGGANHFKEVVNEIRKNNASILLKKNTHNSNQGHLWLLNHCVTSNRACQKAIE